MDHQARSRDAGDHGGLNVGGKPVDLKLSPDGSVVFNANETENGVSVIDWATMAELAFIPTGAGTHGLYPSRDGTVLYVSNRLGGSVSVIDFATRQVTATWTFGGSPDMGGVSTDGTPAVVERPLQQRGVRARHEHRRVDPAHQCRRRAARARDLPATGPVQHGAHRELPVTPAAPRGTLESGPKGSSGQPG